MKPKVIVSACLLGEYCRYDGKTKRYEGIEQLLEGYEIIPFCPEAPLFGTPRERINVVEINGKKHIVTDETNVDVTQKLQEEIERFIVKYPKADRIILKSKSPSCGLGTTPILDQNKDEISKGNGLAADLFLKHYKESEISDEQSLSH